MTDRIQGRRRERRNRAILAVSDICHICGQPGADAVDHIVSLARGGSEDRSNLAPAHHRNPPHCNLVKGSKLHAPIVRRSGSLS